MEQIGQYAKTANGYFSSEHMNEDWSAKAHATTAGFTTATAVATALIATLGRGKLPLVTSPVFLAALGFGAHATTRYALVQAEASEKIANAAIYGVLPAERGLVWGALAASLIAAVRSPSLASLSTLGATAAIGIAQAVEPIQGNHLYAQYGAPIYQKLEDAYDPKGNRVLQYYAGAYFKPKKHSTKLQLMGALSTTISTAVFGALASRVAPRLNPAVIAAVGYAANIGARHAAWSNLPRIRQSGKANAIFVGALPALRGIVFGALTASLIGVVRGRTGFLTLAAATAVATAQLVEPKHRRQIYSWAKANYDAYRGGGNV